MLNINEKKIGIDKISVLLRVVGFANSTRNS